MTGAMCGGDEEMSKGEEWIERGTRWKDGRGEISGEP
jgi:hypothetical protein